MKLQLGKRYVRRDGKVTGPLEEISTQRFFTIRDPETEFEYLEDGKYYPDQEHSCDLVSEYIAPDAVKVTDDGGPAYPSGKSENPGFENSHPLYEGMTLRDWFAGMALQGMLASGAFGAEIVNESGENCGVVAYMAADEALAARKGRA